MELVAPNVHPALDSARSADAHMALPAVTKQSIGAQENFKFYKFEPEPAPQPMMVKLSDVDTPVPAASRLTVTTVRTGGFGQQTGVIGSNSGHGTAVGGFASEGKGHGVRAVNLAAFNRQPPPGPRPHAGVRVCYSPSGHQ
jgi:hypothetical protein